MPIPLSPPPLTVDRGDHLPAYLSNGLMGVRCDTIPFRRGTAILNGFAGIDPVDGVEGFARVPFPIAGDVEIDGVRISRAGHQLHFVEQRYDVATAELTTELEFRLEGVMAALRILTFCSRSLPSVVCQEIRVEVDRASDVAVSAGLDGAEVPGSPDFPDGVAGSQRTPVDQLLVWRASGDVARAGMAYHTELLGSNEPERGTSRRDERGMVSTTYRFRARAGRAYRLRQLTSIVPDLVSPHPEDQAARSLASAVQRGWTRIRQENHDAWDELWQGRIEADGADRRWQSIIDASVFYLLSSVHQSSIASTSLFGLAYWPNYHYYRGHVMWDVETFAVPPLLFLQPDGARAILEFRARHLDAAQRNAQVNGYRGAMYPWEACPIHGEEVTPGNRPPTKVHASMDVALAFAAYCDVIDGDAYLRARAWPVLEEVARFIESLAVATRRGVEIRQTTGPAEVAELVDNDAFVNMAAAETLRRTIELGRRIGVATPERWSRIAERMVLPLTGTGGAIRNHDGYRIDEPKGGTPEAAAGIFPVGYRVPPATERATFRFAAEDQAPRYVGTPMLSAFLPYYALRGGRPDLVEDLLEHGYGDFVNEPFLEIDEFSKRAQDKPKAGPMFANIGGFLTTLLYGYPGIRLGLGSPDSWAERPVRLPPGWRSIHVPRIWARGRPVRLLAVEGSRRATLEDLLPKGEVA